MKPVAIAEKYRDLAGKWRARVAFDDGSSAFLKFQAEPPDKAIMAAAEDYIVRRKQAAAAALEAQAKIAAEQEKAVLVQNLSVDELRIKLEGTGVAVREI